LPPDTIVNSRHDALPMIRHVSLSITFTMLPPDFRRMPRRFAAPLFNRSSHYNDAPMIAPYSMLPLHVTVLMPP